MHSLQNFDAVTSNILDYMHGVLTTYLYFFWVPTALPANKVLISLKNFIYKLLKSNNETSLEKAQNNIEDFQHKFANEYGEQKKL